MRKLTPVLLICLAALTSPAVTAPLSAQDGVGVGGGTDIKNPYYSETKWRVWRDDDSPVADVKTLVKEGKEKKWVDIALAPTDVAKRWYPAGRPGPAGPIAWKAYATPPAEFSGMWDDVYACWDRLHAYVRWTWTSNSAGAVSLKAGGADQIMHFAEQRPTAEIQRCGVNFVHQSTTGMGHTIANHPMVTRERNWVLPAEEIYFSDCLITSPCHASFTESHADRTTDLYLALMPTFFNSIGSSGSETAAITKLMIVGGYLPPETKLTLKRHGLYPGALLYLWKAALPFDVPYGHELRHRISYRAIGDDARMKAKYGHAGSERGNLAIHYHRYDEIAHMRNMIAMAQDMKVTPPEAILDAVSVTGGTLGYAIKKTAVVLQEEGQEAVVQVSVDKSYDLADRPLTYRWRLLYGNRDTTVMPTPKEGRFEIRVPWDDALPTGRAALVLIANNGVHDSNPAVVNIYRKRGELPQPGFSPGQYGYKAPKQNRRPVLVDLQDRVVKPGEKVEIDLVAVDPEGQDVRWFKRAGEAGEIDGNRFTWEVPKGAKGTITVHFIASDASAGNSYAAEPVNFVVAPAVHAHIKVKGQFGVAPFTVEVSSEGSGGAGKPEFGWEFYTPTAKHKPAAFAKLVKGAQAKHTFAKPGRYAIALTVKCGKVIDRQMIPIEVTAGEAPEPPSGLAIEGNGVRLGEGRRPTDFDGTWFGKADEGGTVVHRFLVINRETKVFSPGAGRIEIQGKHERDFEITVPAFGKIPPGGSSTFEVTFAPKGGGVRTAELCLSVGRETRRFALAGESSIDQGAVDAAAEADWQAAKKLFDGKQYLEAAKALEGFMEKHPASSQAETAAGLLKVIGTDPKVREAIDREKKVQADAKDAEKAEKRAKSLFKMAESAEKNGRADLAKKYWEQILERYPDTTWAPKAKARLGN